MTKKQLAAMRKKPCLACGSTPTDVAHIRSKGAGGPMEDWNLIPLCREHHRIQHQVGWIEFVCRYPMLQFELTDRGWQLINSVGTIKYWNSKLLEGK